MSNIVGQNRQLADIHPHTAMELGIDMHVSKRGKILDKNSRTSQ